MTQRRANITRRQIAGGRAAPVALIEWPTPPLPQGARRWRRAIAWWVDAGVAMAASIPVWVAVNLIGPPLGLRQINAAVTAAVVLSGALWLPPLLLWRGRTVGQRAMSLTVMREDGSPAGYGRRLSHAALGLALCLSLLWPLGWIWAVRSRRQFLHDWMAGCCVQHQ